MAKVPRSCLTTQARIALLLSRSSTINGPHPGNLAFEIGKSDLVRERGEGLEVSFRQSAKRTKFEINLFRNRMRDFVYLAPTGRIVEGLFEADYQQADARYLGRRSAS